MSQFGRGVFHRDVKGLDAPHNAPHKLERFRVQVDAEYRQRLDRLWPMLRERAEAKANLRRLAAAVAKAAKADSDIQQSTARLFITLGQCQPVELLRRGHPAGLEWIRTNYILRERQL